MRGHLSGIDTFRCATYISALIGRDLPTDSSPLLPSGCHLLLNVMPSTPSRRYLCGWLLLLAVMPMACTMFNRPGDALFERTALLPPIPKTLDALRLEVIYVDRPIDDPLLRTSLWKSVDQISNLSPEVRGMLRDNGIRFGHVSSTPPRPLQALLELSEESNDLSRQQFTLPSGADTTIETSPILPERQFSFRRADADVTDTYKNARCVLRVSGERLQDGWARLDFLPEIHHSRHVTRPVAGDESLEFRTAQALVPLYAQRFAVTLNAGDILLLTVDRESPQLAGSIGQHFFLNAHTENRMQRLLIVRLAQIQRIEPTR